MNEWVSAVTVMRRMPSILKWIRHGCSGPPPPTIKRIIIESYLQKFELPEFIETGTFRGDTLAWIARNGSTQCSSIELSSEFYRKAVERFRNQPNVTLLQGDSGTILPQLVRNLKRPALFWLDGHYSGLGTGKAEIDTPIEAELMSIFEHPVKNHVVLIDDAHCFKGTNGYPALDSLIEFIRSRSNYHFEISANIIRLTPAAA
jgi:hypothetical protein